MTIIFGEIMASAGYIYIMTNKSFNREDWIKIGYTTNLHQRQRSLSNTGLPYDYELYAYYEVPAIDHMQDKALHNLIVKLNPKMRLVKNREFFEITPQDAYEVLELMATIHGTKDKLHKCDVGDSFVKESIAKNKDKTNTKHNLNDNVDLSVTYEDTFYCKGNGAIATGKLLQNKSFVVLAGSRISQTVTPSLSANKRCYYDMRNDLVDEGSIEDYVFIKDVVFKSPSAASCVILGRSSNGLRDWRTLEGRLLRELYE